MTQDESLKLALEDLTDRFSEGWHEGIKIDASDIMLLSKAAEALAQPEQTNIERHEANVQKFLGAPQPAQEPVAWMDADGKTFPFVWNVSSLNVRQGLKYLDESLTPLYTTPPQRTWVGLTRAERFEIEKAMSKYYDYQHECKTVCLPEFAAAIEAKLKEKNT